MHSDGAEASFAVQFHLLGTVDYEESQRLQRQLVYEAGGQDDGRIVVLLCEHPPLISVGRSGSRGHIRWTNEQLRMRQLDVRWVNRGGGCVLHAPGQLAIYPIVPLAWHGWTVGEYLRRFRQALTQTLDELADSVGNICPEFRCLGTQRPAGGLRRRGPQLDHLPRERF